MPALAIVGITVVIPGPAFAACSGYSCHGLDPTAQACGVTSTAGPVYAVTNGVTYATLWNRYSFGCNANWARAQLSAASVSAGYRLYAYVYTSDSRGSFEYMCWPGIPNNACALSESCAGFPNAGYGGSSVVYTDMVDGTNVTYANVIVLDTAGHTVAAVSVSQ